MNRCWSVVYLSAVIAGGGWCSLCRADDAAAGGEAGVRAAAAAYVAAFNAHDAAAVGRLWAEKAIYTDRQTGARTHGRAAIQADLERVFAAQPQVRLQFDAGEIRFIRPDVAQAEAVATVVVPDEEPTVVNVSAIYSKVGDEWLLDSVEEIAVPTPESSATALQPLEWLIGDWKDDSDGVDATSSFRWAAEGSFLVRSFSVARSGEPVSEGTQVIGWDPRGRQIRSWTFNSDGSFGEAIWSRSGGDWLIKSIQTLADGGAASGTYVLTPIDRDNMTVRLIGHEVNGEPQPSRDAVRVVRVGQEQAAAEANPDGGAAGTGGDR